MSFSGIASGHFTLGHFDEAITWARRAIAANPHYMFGYVFLAASAAQLGDITEARKAIQAALRIRPDLTLAGKASAPMRFPERRALLLDGLRRAGLPER
jgi:tetratricopeptide (TPR) repeat protein